MEVDWLYPIRVITTGAVLVLLWRHYQFSTFRISLVSVAAGVLVFLFWVVLVSGNIEKNEIMATELERVPEFAALFWIVFRILGSVVTVPIAEELAFRGYLIGRLAGGNFDADKRLHFSWVAWILSSVLFGLLHSAWLAGMAAGLVYGLVRYHRNKLADAIVAHAVTNLLLSGYVLSTGSWSMW